MTGRTSEDTARVTLWSVEDTEKTEFGRLNEERGPRDRKGGTEGLGPSRD